MISKVGCTRIKRRLDGEKEIFLGNLQMNNRFNRAKCLVLPCFRPARILNRTLHWPEDVLCKKGAVSLKRCVSKEGLRPGAWCPVLECYRHFCS